MICGSRRNGERKVKRDDMWSMAKWGEEGKETLYLEHGEVVKGG